MIPGFEARLVDGEGRPVLLGATGELWIKGESTATGYWNRHARSRRTMQGSGSAPGTCHCQDTDGYFYFSRAAATTMLKVGGGLGIAGGSRGAAWASIPPCGRPG